MSGNLPRIALITDSTCDIPDDLLRRYNICFAPQILIWGSDQYLDRVNFSHQDFYARLPKDRTPPRSSQPVAADFLKLLQEAERGGAEEAVIVTISNQLSGTLESAQQAAAQVGMPVHVVDSLSAAMGLGWQVLAAARVREAGSGAQAMVEAADRVRQTVQVIFMVDTLEYLHRGGRIGGAARLIGSALDLKPVLYVDHSVGRIEPGERTRTRNKALECLHQTYFERMDTSRPMHIAVQHTDSLADAQEMAARIQSEFQPAELLVTLASPVVGTHAGPGGVGIVGYYEN